MQGLMGILDMVKGHGITTAHDSGVFNERMMKAYSDLEKDGKLDVRIKGEQVLDPGQGVEQIPALVSERDNYSSGLVADEDCEVVHRWGRGRTYRPASGALHRSSRIQVVSYLEAGDLQ